VRRIAERVRIGTAGELDRLLRGGGPEGRVVQILARRLRERREQPDVAAGRVRGHEVVGLADGHVGRVPDLGAGGVLDDAHAAPEVRFLVLQGTGSVHVDRDRAVDHRQVPSGRVVGVGEDRVGRDEDVLGPVGRRLEAL
jgi:hypothetical protein